MNKPHLWQIYTNVRYFCMVYSITELRIIKQRTFVHSPGGAQLLETPPENEGTKWLSDKVGGKKSKYSQASERRHTPIDSVEHSGLSMIVDVCRLSEAWHRWHIDTPPFVQSSASPPPSLQVGFLTVAPLRGLSLGHAHNHWLFYCHIGCPQYNYRFSP